jgi:hypothetical protein
MIRSTIAPHTNGAFAPVSTGGGGGWVAAATVGFGAPSSLIPSIAADAIPRLDGSPLTNNNAITIHTKIMALVFTKHSLSLVFYSG